MAENYDTFTCFPKFPTELRLMIWKFSFIPRHLNLKGGSWENSQRTSVGHCSPEECRRDRNKTQQEFPAALHTNKEGRYECIRYYEMAFPKVDAKYLQQQARLFRWGHRGCSLLCSTSPLWMNTKADTIYIDFCDLKDTHDKRRKDPFFPVLEQAPRIFGRIRMLEIRNLPVLKPPRLKRAIARGIAQNFGHLYQLSPQIIHRVMPCLVRFPFLEVLCFTLQDEAQFHLTQDMKDGLLKEIKSWLKTNPRRSISKHLTTIHIRRYVELSTGPLSLDDSTGTELSTFTPGR